LPCFQAIALGIAEWLDPFTGRGAVADVGTGERTVVPRFVVARLDREPDTAGVTRGADNPFTRSVIAGARTVSPATSSHIAREHGEGGAAYTTRSRKLSTATLGGHFLESSSDSGGVMPGVFAALPGALIVPKPAQPSQFLVAGARTGRRP
jgi:hypothetical protein